MQEKRPGPAPRSLGIEDLVEYFRRAGRPAARHKVGMEYEILAVDSRTGLALPFVGEVGVESLIRRMHDRLGWKLVRENDHVIGLTGPGGASVSTEPGGQIEYSGPPHRGLIELEAELDSWLELLNQAAGDEDILFVGLGLQPISRHEDMELVPKARYMLLRPALADRSQAAERMMKQSASVQVNIDYLDEEDAMRKLKVSHALAPIFNALFANSPLCEGSPSGMMSTRSHCWNSIEKRRCDYLPTLFDREPTFRTYVDYALGKSMTFIKRHGQWIRVKGRTFGEFLEEGHEGLTATLEDWVLHLTTLYPEIRLKQYLEFRCFDLQSRDEALAIPAIVRGIFYHRPTLDAAWELVKDWTWEERLAAASQAHKVALDSRIRGQTMGEIARDLVALARGGIAALETGAAPAAPAGERPTFTLPGEKRRYLRARPGEGRFLDPLDALVERGQPPAGRVLEFFRESAIVSTRAFLDRVALRPARLM